MMGIRKSLGYSPLGEPESDESQFNFVADRKPAGAAKVTSIFKDAETDSNMTLATSFSEKVIKNASEEEAQHRPEKKVASYYLELDTVKRLKSWANKKKVSYSSIVEQALQKHLKSLGG